MNLSKNSEKTFAIVADDLTGANDTGIQFFKKGLKTIVILGLEVKPELISDTDIIVLNTDSRLLKPEQAYTRTRQTGRVLKNLQISRVYKKIDSTLRGNIGAEVEALMEVLEVQVCFLTPALPIYDRTVQDGNLYLKGIPIHQTAIAKDPAFQMKNASISDLLKQQTQRKIENVSLGMVRRGRDTLFQEFSRLLAEGVQILILDAIVQSDLKIAAQAIAMGSPSALICGSAGLASEIPEAFNLRKSSVSGQLDSGLRTQDSGLSVVGICGSMSTVTQEQVDYAVKSLQIPVLEFMPDKLVSRKGARQYTPTAAPLEEIQRVVADAIFLLSQGKDILVVVGPSSTPYSALKSKFVQNGRIIAEALGILAGELLKTGKVSGLFLTGGDIALSVCQALRAKGIYLLDEVLPGIPLGQLIGGEYAGLKIITKAGAFGQPEAIARCIEYLKKESKSWKKNPSSE